MLNYAHQSGPIPTPRAYGKPAGVSVGAIRWDGVYSDTAVLTQENGYLGPNQYHFRAPWWSTVGDGTINVQGNAATMDAEIDYAVNANLDYWACFYYSTQQTNGMNRGFELFQASAQSYRMKWCYAWGSHGYFNYDVTNSLAAVITRIQKANYHKVLGNRPLVYVYDDGNGTNSATSVTTFRAACISAGLGNPFLVAMGTSAVSAAAIKTANGFDAISMYAYQTNKPSSYDYLAQEAKDNWRRLSALTDMVPNLMLGWQPKPRAATAFYDYALPSQIADHVQDGIDYAAAASSNCSSKAVLAYAWNEHSEGGWLCPTYVDGITPNTTHIDAAALALSPVLGYARTLADDGGASSFVDDAGTTAFTDDLGY